MKIYVDEVGMASIAGPIIVCAVAVKNDANPIKGATDSKQISRKKRESLFEVIKNTLPHAYGAADLKRIKKLNIYWARYEAMREAVKRLANGGINISEVIVDGKFEIPNFEYKQKAIIKADSKFWQMGAASILAKVTRDRIMENYSKIEKFSYYGFETNAGYYSPEHRNGIIKYGPTDLHRRTFKYFKYCLFEHRRCKEFVKNGKSVEDYFEHIKKISKDSNKSNYKIWCDSKKVGWDPILPKVV